MAKRAKTGRNGRAPDRRRYATGEASRANILNRAERVLIRDGYHAFTMRRVADECGLSVGNLTYYFPNKSSLIEAVMEEVFERYQRHYTELLARSSDGSEDPVGDLVTWLLQDAVTDATAKLFLELWVMAKHQRAASKALTRFYDKGVSDVAQALAGMFPGHSERELERLAYFILTLSEGSTAVFARSGDRSVAHEEIIPLAIEAVKGLLNRESAGWVARNP